MSDLPGRLSGGDPRKFFKTNKDIREVTTRSYASSNAICEGILDCSLGVNRYNISVNVLQAFRGMDENLLKDYPHDSSVIDWIISKYSPGIELDRREIVLGNGSYDLLCKLNRIFLNKGDRVLGIAPRFPEYIGDVDCIGAKHISCRLLQSNNYLFSTIDFIERLTDDFSLVCLENPNNPTGQIISLENIEKVVKAAHDRGIFVVVDEAYGEYMPIGNSAAMLVHEYNNVCVTRSFSKGYGLAGIRMGYLICPSWLTDIISKISSPYDCNSIARLLSIEMLKNTRYCEELMKLVIRDKTAFIKQLGNLKVAQTDNSVPIMLLYAHDTEVNLLDVFMQAKILTVSGLAFEGLGQNSVRLMVCPEIDVLNARMKAVLQNIGGCKKICVNGYTMPRSEYGHHQGSPGRTPEGLQGA